MLASLAKAVKYSPPKKSFSELSKGGQRKNRLALLDKTVTCLAGESTESKVELLDSLLDRRGYSVVRESLEVNVPSEFAQVIENIRICHESVTANEKAQHLSLVSNFTGTQLKKYGFNFSNRSLKNARNHAINHTPGLPKPHFTPPSKRAKSENLKNAVYKHLLANSSPMANTTTKINGENVPSRGVIDTWNYLYHDFCEKHPTSEHKLCKSTWDKLRKSFKIFKKAKKTDICEICANGKKLSPNLTNSKKNIQASRPTLCAKMFVGISMSVKIQILKSISS
eukprot:TRINITY_DN3104_c0_g1_i3.p1 TRINITY_DN3104_c0_g1~~TRINITY_DN3104_c0_g1_i3.p1  ORF type:complete len:282 (-),score=43.13 TRINITY_DN3104_c0_g1_i3:389-1234(-)